MSSSPSFLDALLAVKKQQATQLFGPWDTEDEGRIAVQHVRPLLLSVFPAAADAPLFLTAGRVKAAYEAVTRRSFSPPAAVVVAAATSAHHHRRPCDPMYVGPTLDELHRLIDHLASTEAQTAALPSSAAATTRGKGLGVRSALPPDNPLYLSASSSLGSSAAKPSGASATARLLLLRGSIEHVFRVFCEASAAAGELAPAVLPTDAAHLERLSWAVRARHLQLGEGHALHQLLNSLSTAPPGTDNAITSDAFVSLMCAV